MRTRIKFCGIGRPEDALAAADAGADAIGLVFHRPAPRFVSLARAREILGVLPAFVTPVGLFVNAEPGEMLDVAGELGLRCVQLHGDETADTVAALRTVSVLKSVRVARETFRADLDRWRRAIDGLRLTHLRGLVLETASATSTAPGGTGIANDWDFIRQCREDGAFEGLPPIIAAGGLSPHNVADVIRNVRPWAVDVSSGVESAKGIKSQEKIVAFAKAVRAGDDGV